MEELNNPPETKDSNESKSELVYEAIVLQSGPFEQTKEKTVIATTPTTRDQLSRTVSRIVIRRRLVLLALACITGVSALWISRDFSLDRRLESMFPKNSKVLNDYQLLKRSFGGNEVVLLVYSDDQFWGGSEESMQRLEQLGGQIATIPGVRAVMDLSQIDKLIRSAESGVASLFSRVPKPNSEGKYLSGIRGTTPLDIAMRKTFEGYTHSAKGSWLAIAAILEPTTSNPLLSQTTNSEATGVKAVVRQQTNGSLIAAIRKTAANSFPSESDYYLVGEPVLVEEGFDLIEKDGIRLGWTSALALSLFLIIILRTIRWTIATLAVVYWSLWMTRAICVLSGWQLTMVSSMLVAMVTVISIATCMHWFVSYQRFRVDELNDSGNGSKRSLRSQAESLEISLNELIRPIMWACITNALAFSALLAAHVEPVRDYGLMMAVASLAVLVGIFCIVPGIVLFGNSTQHAITGFESTRNRFMRIEQNVGLWLRGVLEVVLARPIWTGSFLGIWILCTVIGTWQVEIETDFLKNFRSSSPLVQGYRVVEEHLGGAGVWDVIVPAPQTITREYLAEVASLDEKLSGLAEMGLTKVISLAGAEAAARKSPLLARLTPTLRLGAMRASIPAFYDSLLMPDGLPEATPRRLRIMLRAKENVSAETKQSLIQTVTRIVDTHTKSSSWRAMFEGATRSDSSFDAIEHDAHTIDSQSQVTGYYVLLASLVQSVVNDQWICFVLATVLIAFALRMAIGSWSLATIALVPNTLPSLGILAAMGLIGMKMNLGAALIAAVSLGLSVDSSLHYLCQYVKRREEGLTVHQSLLDCQSRVGIPLLLSTATLIIGFGSLATSEFVPTIVFGTTAAISMFLGLIGNLWWLPMLVAWTEGDS